LGIVHLLSLATDVAGFKEWLVAQRSRQATAQVFKGYVFGLGTLIRLLHMAIDFDFSLRLSENFTFSRARFYGTPIAEVPNSCQKAILLRNINKASRQLLGTKSWSQMEPNAKEFNEVVLAPFQQLSLVSKLRLPKITPDHATALNFIAQWHMHLFLHDTRRGYPHGYRQPMLNDSLTSERLAEVFEGYKLTVQYLWFKLLGDGFIHSITAEIHKAPDWKRFDGYYRVAQHELIDPKEKLTGLYVGFNTLLVARPGAKRIISKLLEPKVKEQPLPLEKELQRKFLWYNVELVDASSAIFNGVIAFISVLNGAVIFRQRIGNSNRLLVMRVKHPAGGTIRGRPKFDYSYAILMEGHGSFGISDYSGWLLFFDCCGDYSGFAGSQYAMAEKEIGQHRNQKTIEVHEITVAKDKFLKLMQTKLLSTTKDIMQEAIQTRSNLRSVENRLGAACGILLELLGMRHYYRTSTGPVRIEWSYERLDQEIDLIAGNDDSITFVECKKPGISDPFEQVKKLKDKVSVLWGYEEFEKEWRITSKTKKVFVFATWERPQPDVFTKLQSQGVNVIILSSESEKAGIGQKARDHLKLALDIEKSKPTLTRDEFFGPLSI